MLLAGCIHAEGHTRPSLHLERRSDERSTELKVNHPSGPTYKVNRKPYRINELKPNQNHKNKFLRMASSCHLRRSYRVYGWNFDGAARTCLVEASQSPQAANSAWPRGLCLPWSLGLVWTPMFAVGGDLKMTFGNIPEVRSYHIASHRNPT